ncbi:MAG: stage III sporulation protein AB [Clostridia bacterium]|nr:stage III sporulation protein AB [Clostridia bacterium]
MRFLLAFFTAVLCAVFGLRKAKALTARTKLLGFLADDINGLINSMEYSRAPVLKLISSLTPCRAESFWRMLEENISEHEELHDAYKKTMAQLKSEKTGFEKLHEDDLVVLDEFFSLLGKGSMENERRNARGILSRLETLEKDARQAQEKGGKLYSSLGILSGLAFAIIIL